MFSGLFCVLRFLQNCCRRSNSYKRVYRLMNFRRKIFRFLVLPTSASIAVLEQYVLNWQKCTEIINESAFLYYSGVLEFKRLLLNISTKRVVNSGLLKFTGFIEDLDTGWSFFQTLFRNTRGVELPKVSQRFSSKAALYNIIIGLFKTEGIYVPLNDDPWWVYYDRYFLCRRLSVSARRRFFFCVEGQYNLPNQILLKTFLKN
jgi:hypothetical protein